jgi:hypothetical protein
MKKWEIKIQAIVKKNAYSPKDCPSTTSGNNQNETKPVRISINGYLQDILAPQKAHFPRRKRKLKTGILWYHFN